MCRETTKCIAWISLDNIGFPSHGCLRDPTYLNSLKIPCYQSIIEPRKYIDLPNKKLIFIKTVAHGKFGYIDEVQLETTYKIEKLFCKRPVIAGKSLIYEALMLKLVGETLEKVGFPNGAPKLCSIFKLKDDSICFAMEQIENAMTLDRYLERLPINKLIFIIIDCLFQLCSIIWHLNNILGVNHRDLKPSNFLVVEHSEPVTKVLSVENEIFEIESRYSLTLIDFGFSCLGSVETHVSDISLSTVYSKNDPCPKDGRDIFIFLSFLYIDYYAKLPDKLLKLFEAWLDVPGSKLCSFMRRDKETSKNWIYFMAGNEKISKFNCSPLKIIKDLQGL